MGGKVDPRCVSSRRERDFAMASRLPSNHFERYNNENSLDISEALNSQVSIRCGELAFSPPRAPREWCKFAKIARAQLWPNRPQLTDPTKWGSNCRYALYFETLRASGWHRKAAACAHSKTLKWLPTDYRPPQGAEKRHHGEKFYRRRRLFHRYARYRQGRPDRG